MGSTSPSTPTCTAATTLGGLYADGISFDLAAAPPTPGSVGDSGGALGYSTDGTTPGMPGGYLGVGLDEYGNYTNPTYQGNSCHQPFVGRVCAQRGHRAGPRQRDERATACCRPRSRTAPIPSGSSGIQLHGNDFASSTVTVHVVIDSSNPSNPTYSVTLQPRGRPVTHADRRRGPCRASTTTRRRGTR